jgi:hypothetical protein
MLPISITKMMKNPLIKILKITIQFKTKGRDLILFKVFESMAMGVYSLIHQQIFK